MNEMYGASSLLCIVTKRRRLALSMRSRAIIRGNPDCVSRHRGQNRALSSQDHRTHLVPCREVTVTRESDLDLSIHLDDRFLALTLKTPGVPRLAARSQPVDQS